MRPTKPDDVEVLHYRMYKHEGPYERGEHLSLQPRGGMTVAVRYPVSGEMTLELGVSLCSMQDTFCRRTGYNRALGKFLSARQRVVIDDIALLNNVGFHQGAVDNMTFVEKQAALNALLNLAWRLNMPTEIADALFAPQWADHAFSYGTLVLLQDHRQTLPIDARSSDRAAIREI